MNTDDLTAAMKTELKNWIDDGVWPVSIPVAALEGRYARWTAVLAAALPSAAWGSADAVEEWAQMGGARGLAAEQDFADGL